MTKVPIDIVQSTIYVLGGKQAQARQARSDAATVAFLLLLKSRYGFGVDDICALMAALVPRPGEPLVESALLTSPPKSKPLDPIISVPV